MTSHPVLEHIIFRLRPGIDRAAFEQAAGGRITAFLERQPGFIRRQLSVAPGGEWVELVWWRDRAAAEAASGAFVASSETAPMMAALDQATAVSLILDPVEVAGEFGSDGTDEGAEASMVETTAGGRA